MTTRIVLLAFAVLGGSTWGAGNACAPALATGRRMMTARDYKPERPDGRTAKAIAWARKKLAEKGRLPAHPFLKDRATYLAWRKGFLERHVAYLDGVRENPTVTLVSEEPRDGYRLRLYEFHPYPRAVVRTYVLVPDDARPGKTPVVFCFPGSSGSLEGLAGEKDGFFVRYPIRNRQAWWYAKCGMIAVALENPGTAGDAAEDTMWWMTRAHLREALPKLGSCLNALTVREVAILASFLMRDPLVDASCMATSGMSLGALSALYPALLIPEVSALVYNDFACDDIANRLSMTEYPSARNYGGGADLEALMALAPKKLLLNEGGAFKGVIEDIKRAYELMGCPENLEIHYYDKFADPKSRTSDDVDIRTLSGLDQQEWLTVCNCHEYDHSFHAESALPWMRGLFFGMRDVPSALLPEIVRARAERERKPEELFPPDGVKGRRAYGPERPFVERDFIPERADGRSVKAHVWSTMEIRDRLRAKSVAQAKSFKLLSVARRDGYALETWEFYPDDILAVKTMFLIPDAVVPFVTPIEICLATDEASVEGLAGEDDPYRVACEPTALQAVRKGRIAVALALPGCANGAPDDLDSADSRRRFIALLKDSEWSDERLIGLEIRMCTEFLQGRVDFATNGGVGR